MIKSYSRPQLLVRQILDILPDPEEKTLNAFVLGPQYDLFRYTNADERAAMLGAAFVENTDPDPDVYQKISYEGLKSHHIVDQAYTRLYGEQLEGQLWAAASAVNDNDVNEFDFKLVSLLTPNKIRAHRRGAVISVTFTAYSGEGYLISPTITYKGSGYTPSITFDFTVPGGAGTVNLVAAVVRVTTNADGEVSAVAMASPGSGYTGAPSPFEVAAHNVGANVGYADDTLVTGLRGRPIRNGDVLYATLNGTKVRRSVRLVEREKVVAHYGTNKDNANALLADDQIMDHSVLNPLATTNATFGNTSSPANWAVALATGAAASDWDGKTQGSNFGTNTTNALKNVQYDNQYGERYTITVTKANTANTDNDVSGRVRIRSASGAFSTNNAVVTKVGAVYTISDAALGGLKVKLTAPDAATALKLGDTFTFVVIGAYTPLELENTGALTAITSLAVGSAIAPGTHALTIEAPLVGTGATGECVVGGGGTVTSATILTPGSGYLSAPLITLVISGNITNATFRGTVSTPETSRDLTVVNGMTYRGPVDTRYIVKVTKGGVLLNTTSTPAVPCTVEISDTAGIDRIQQYSITQGTKYDLGTYGLQLLFPASQTIGVTATVTGTLSSGSLASTGSLVGGSGYTSTPKVVITGNAEADKTIVPAAAHAVVVNGVVTSIVIDSAGDNYQDITLTIDPPRRFLRTGDVFYIDAVAEKAVGPYSIIVLNGQASDITGWTDLDLALNKFDIDVRALYSGIVVSKRDTAPLKAWRSGTAAEGGIFLKDTLRLFIAERDTDYQWVPIKNSAYARLFAHWRGLVPATSGDKIKLYGSEDAITTAFGIEDYDNPLCQGALIAFRGAQEKPVFAAKIATDNLAGYATVIRQAENAEGIYAICPTGYDLQVGTALKAHVDKMSMENWKLWRRVYLGYQNPGAYVTMDNKDDGTPYVATVTSNASGNVRVICTDGDFVSRGIRPGDLFRISYYADEWGEPTYSEYVVYTVLEEDELILESGPVSPLSPATNFQIWRPNTGLSQCEWAGERAESYSDRRVITVWCDTPQQTDANGEVQHPAVYYVAAEVAGLRSAVLPQQGLSLTELQHSLDACPLMFTKYTQEELDVAAAKGVFIVKQDHEDGPIYIRHQLTTDTSHGILYYEDSVGTNLDNISYTVKALLTPYPGKRNANPEVLEELETKMRSTLTEFMKNPGGYTSIGPALIRWTNLKIGIDRVFKDRINIEVDLELPLPINTLLVKLRGRTIQEDLIISTEILVANPNV